MFLLQIFVSGNGPYGPLGRSRVFNEAMHVVGNRIPAATARYLRQAETESVPDACLSCAEDVSQSCKNDRTMQRFSVTTTAWAVMMMPLRPEVRRGKRTVLAAYDLKLMVGLVVEWYAGIE